MLIDGDTTYLIVPMMKIRRIQGVPLIGKT